MAETAAVVTALPSAQFGLDPNLAYEGAYNALHGAECVVEKKNDLSYVSWARALDELYKRVPTATYKVVEYGEVLRDGVGNPMFDEWGDPRVINGEPFQRTSAGCFVRVKVNVLGVVKDMRLPVFGETHLPIAEPTVMDINTSIQRCLTKAIALHGVGLFVYQGEDLPAESAKRKKTEEAAPSPKKSRDPLPVEKALEKVNLSGNPASLWQHAQERYTGEDLARIRAAIEARSKALGLTLPATA
jgi:hypothetical protein